MADSSEQVASSHGGASEGRAFASGGDAQVLAKHYSVSGHNQMVVQGENNHGHLHLTVNPAIIQLLPASNSQTPVLSDLLSLFRNVPQQFFHVAGAGRSEDIDDNKPSGDRSTAAATESVGDCPLDPVLILDIANRIYAQNIVEALATRLLHGCGGLGFIEKSMMHGSAVNWNTVAHRVISEWCTCKPEEVTGQRLFDVLYEAGAPNVALTFQDRLGAQRYTVIAQEVAGAPGEAAVPHPDRLQAAPPPVDGVLISEITPQKRARLFYMIADDFQVKRREIVAHLLSERANEELSLMRSGTALPPSEKDLLYEGLEMWFKRSMQPCGRELYDSMVYAKCDKGQRSIFDYRDILKLPRDYKPDEQLSL